MLQPLKPGRNSEEDKQKGLSVQESSCGEKVLETNLLQGMSPETFSNQSARTGVGDLVFPSQPVCESLQQPVGVTAGLGQFWKA